MTSEEFCEKIAKYGHFEKFPDFFPKQTIYSFKKVKVERFEYFYVSRCIVLQICKQFDGKSFQDQKREQKSFLLWTRMADVGEKESIYLSGWCSFPLWRAKNKTKACSKKLTVFFKNLIFSRLLKVSLYSLELHNPVTCHMMMKHFNKIKISV